MIPQKNDKSNDRLLQKLIVTEPRLFARLADQHLHSGEVKKAAKTLVKGLQQFPDSVPGWLVKGMLHLQLKQPKLARAAFEKALSIDSEIPIAHRHSAELAQQEGDIDGYLNHLKALSTLEPLDDNLQAMLQTAMLRQTAVAKGLYSQPQVERMMPGTLRQALLRANALPPEIARRTERFAFPPETNPEAENTPSESPEPTDFGSRPVWKDPKVKEQIARMEEADRERVVRVAWADALSNPSETPLVEIDEEQLLGDSDINSASNDTQSQNTRTSDSEIRAQELRSKPVAPPVLPPRTGSQPEMNLPPSMQKAMIKPYIPPPKQAPRPEPLASNLRPLPESPKREAPPPPPVISAGLESDWEGALPAAVIPRPNEPVTPSPEPRKPNRLDSDWDGATPSLPPPSLRQNANDDFQNVRPGQTASGRPRLTADIKLPPMRTIDADDDLPPRRSSASPRITHNEYFETPETVSTSAPKISPELSHIPVEEDFLTPPQALVAPSHLPAIKIEPDPTTEEIKIKSEPGESKEEAIQPPVSPASDVLPIPPLVPKRAFKADPVKSIEEPSRLPRDDSAIQRLLQAKKEPAPPASHQPLPELTRFEMPEDDDPPPPVSLPSRQTIRPPVEVSPPPFVEERPEPELPEPPSPRLAPVTRQMPLPSLKPKAQLPTSRPEPLAPMPKVNERLEVIDEQVAPVVMRMPVQTPSAPPPPDLMAREEAVRQKLAAIVEEVTGKAPALETPPEPPSVEEKGPDYHLKGKIATKTLAELYASQGDWKRSADVYEVLLEKFPTNEAYRKRLDTLKSKINENP